MIGDREARDRASRELSTSIALTAGAGSGKTSVLSARVVNLVASGVEPRNIAAITFTEKAAGELHQRVRDALDGGGAERLPDMVLSTIHGFCQRILRAEALEAGWAPATEVLPSVFQAPEVDRALRAWFDDLGQRHPLAGVLLRRLVRPKTLRDIAARVLSLRDLRPGALSAPLDPARAAADLRAAAAELRAAAEACRAPESDKLLHGNRALLGLLARAEDAPDEDALALVLGARVGPKRTGGRREDWGREGKEGFLAGLDAFDAWRLQQLRALHAVAVADLWERFVPAVAGAKRAAAVADFDDQLFRAAELLERPEVRDRLRARFVRVLIDEVQDTDPIQAQIARRLTEVDGGPGPGRLFAVGDPRQSIYRFRRADVEAWGALEQAIAARGAALALTTNFRSVPGIVSWVNAVFADLPGYVAQQAHRPPAALDPVVRLVSTEDDEWDHVARYLWSLRGRDVVDRASGSARPFAWGDVMILLPAWTKAEELQEALQRAGIPCVVGGGGGFFTRTEVRLALAALRCLDEPADEQATVAVLRGLFGIDWATLAAHHRAGGSWRYFLPDPPPGPVADAFATLTHLARRRGVESWVALLDRLLAHTCAAAVWACSREGEARLANLEKLRALIRELEATVHAPGEVVRQLVATSRTTDEDDLSRADDDHDAVRITSYFKAKGLEAPVVVLCASRRGTGGATHCVDRASGTVAMKLVGELAPPGWEQHEAAERAADQEERRRWMYVAVTRARDQLVVVDNDRADLVRTHLAAGLDAMADVAGASLPAPPAPAIAAATGTPPAEAALAEERAAQVKRAAAGSVRWRAAQAVAHRESVGEGISPVGTAGGTVVHEVMEALDLGRPVEDLLPRVAGLVDASAVARGLDAARAALCVSIVEGMLRHEVIARARAAPERWVEVPFCLRDEGQVISGRIDLCFPTDASRTRWVVVDWKSDLPPRGSPGWNNYQRQLAIYARALLRTVSPCEEVECVLVGPHPELDDPE